MSKMFKYPIIGAIFFLNTIVVAQNLKLEDYYGAYSFDSLAYDTVKINLIQLCSYQECLIWGKLMGEQYRDMLTVAEPAYIGNFWFDSDTLRISINSDTLVLRVLDSLNLMYLGPLDGKMIPDNNTGHRIAAFFPGSTCVFYLFEKMKWYIEIAFQEDDTLYYIRYPKDDESFIVTEPVILDSVRLFK